MTKLFRCYRKAMRRAVVMTEIKHRRLLFYCRFVLGRDLIIIDKNTS